MIQSEEGLKDAILERANSVVIFVCHDPADLKFLAAKLTHLHIDFVLYCPFEPYNHSYDIIGSFFETVETEKEGDYKNVWLSFSSTPISIRHIETCLKIVEIESDRLLHTEYMIISKNIKFQVFWSHFFAWWTVSEQIMWYTSQVQIRH